VIDAPRSLTSRFGARVLQGSKTWHELAMGRARRLEDVYRFPAFRPRATVRGVFGDPKVRIVGLSGGEKNFVRSLWSALAPNQVRDLSAGDTRIYLEIESLRVRCRSCGKVKQEKLAWLSNNPFYTKRFAFFVGRRCRTSTIQDVARELHLDWSTVKELDKQYMQEQLRRAGTPAPRAIGIDEVSIRKGHTYRIVVSDLQRHRPIWFGGQDRSEASLDLFYQWLGAAKSTRVRLAVMDMWKPFRNSTRSHAPQASILFDKFHVMRHLGAALDQVRKSEYARLRGKDRSGIKGQKYTLLSHRDNLTLQGRRSLHKLLQANHRLNVAYLLKESFGQLWDYRREAWARRFFENWKAALKWQRLKPYEKFAAMIDRHWDGIAAYCRPDNKVSLGFVEASFNDCAGGMPTVGRLTDSRFLHYGGPGGCRYDDSCG
jgi:transposase